MHLSECNMPSAQCRQGKRPAARPAPTVGVGMHAGAGQGQLGATRSPAAGSMPPPPAAAYRIQVSPLRSCAQAQLGSKVMARLDYPRTSTTITSRRNHRVNPFLTLASTSPPPSLHFYRANPQAQICKDRAVPSNQL